MAEVSGFTRLLHRLLVLLLLAGSIRAEDCRRSKKGLDYAGRIAKTVTGKTCTRWAVSPKCYTGIVDNNPVDAANFCRNPRGFGDCQLAKPWCYTLDGSFPYKREYCDVPLCGYKALVCSHALGMEKGDIMDSQITASSSMSGHEPARARLNSGDDEGRAGWVASTVDGQQTLKLDLQTLHNVTKVILQGSGKTANAWTKQFKIQYSEDGNNWNFYKEGFQVKLFEGNPARYHGISHTFDPPLRTRFFAVNPTKWHNRPALRLEVHGCAISSGVPRPSGSGITTVLGRLQKNTNLGKKGSPYIFSDEIIVPAGIVLTIEAGTEIKFTNGGIRVEGTLRIHGEENDEVVMLPRDISHRWNGLVFNQTLGTNNEIATSTVGVGSVLRHVRLVNTTDGINIVGPPPRLEHVTVFHSASSGVKFSGFFRGNVTVNYCNFSHNKENGIFIDLEESKANVTVTGSITNNNGVAGMSLSNVKTGTVRFLNNTINDNLRLGLDLHHVNATVVIGNNSFNNNTRLRTREGFTVKISAVSGGQINIENNVFVDNMNYDRIYHIASHHVVYVEYKNTTHLKITGNVFRNNSGYGAIKIDAASQSICRRCSIEDNVFINNTNLQVKREHGYKDWGIKETIRMSGKFHLSLKNNYFDNPDAQFEVTMPSYDGEVTDASGCYWGETSYRNITNRLKCFYNDMSLGLMKFWPYRTSPNNKKLVQRSAEYSFFSEEIGGFVTTNITIRIRQTPYVVGRSMYITENASLTIEAGVTLLFKRDRGVTVKGMIHLQGTADRPIYLNRSSLRPTDWNYHTFPIPWTWAGIVIETNRMDALSISNVAIGGSDSGLRIQKDGVVTIRNCRFYENNKGLQLLSERADVTVTNSEFHHNGFGIVLVDSRTLAIQGCRFTKQIKSGIKGSPGISRQRPETVTIADNTFASNNGAIDLRTSKSTNLRLVRNAIHYSIVKLIVSQCELTFQENNLSTQLDITARNSTIVVRNNTWKRCGRAIWLHYTDDSQTTIENNVFHATTSTYGLIYFYYGGNATLRIRSNEFTENDGMSVIEMDTWTENAKPLEIYWNIFFMNKMNLGIIHVIETSEIHYNSFNNPNTSHDCVVGDVSIDGVTDSSLGRRGVTNATYNWWGVSTESGVSKRIRIGDCNRWSGLDKHTVKWQPFLTHAPHKSCSKVNNCSGHGDCVLQDTCECHTGWTGGLCDRCSDNYYGPRCLPSVETTTPRTSTTTERYTPTKTITTSMPLKTTTTPEIKHTTAGRTGTTACYVLDVVFALDAAGSILRENWSRMTDFFDHFLARMDVNDNCARVSVVTFGSAATLQFGLRAHDNAGSVRRAIEKVGMASPARNFADGIRKVRTTVFNNRNGDRRDAQNVCIFITDGTSGMKQQDALAETSLAKADGINLQVIGIGGNVHLSELSSIASANAIHLNNFGDLNVDGALQMLYSYMDDLKQTLGSTTITTTTRTTTTTTTTTTEPTTTNAVTTFSWQCSFEGSTGKGSLCNMIQSSSDDFDWSLTSGRTPSSETGPNSGYGGYGHYIYIEASQPRRKNDKAMIMLPSFNQDDEYCLSFYYNMNGFHINTLQVAKRTTSGQLVQLWTKNGNQGPHWHSAQVSAELNNSDQLAFIGIRGDAYSGDIAIDNVSVRSGRCLG